MIKPSFFFFTFYFLLLIAANAQQKSFTHADTLRGSITPERAWWDVLKYDITVKPDYAGKTIEGVSAISFKHNVTGKKIMQIDLQSPLIIDSVLYNNKLISFKKADTNVWYLSFNVQPAETRKQENRMYMIPSKILIYYHGKPREAIRPPWDGGWIWKKDKQGRPWMSVACQGLGASVWYPKP